MATGIRVDDILSSLNIAWDSSTITIIESKTQKVKTIEKTAEIAQYIAAYRQAVGIRVPHPFDYLCPSAAKEGAHLNRSTLFRHFQAACAKAGLDGMGYTIHSLRKCFAVNLYRRSNSVLNVQRALNHDRITTTLVYLMDALNINL